jgi:hypothetical protein
MRTKQSYAASDNFHAVPPAVDPTDTATVVSKTLPTKPRVRLEHGIAREDSVQHYIIQGRERARTPGSREPSVLCSDPPCPPEAVRLSAKTALLSVTKQHRRTIGQREVGRHTYFPLVLGEDAAHSGYKTRDVVCQGRERRVVVDENVPLRERLHQSTSHTRIAHTPDN